MGPEARAALARTSGFGPRSPIVQLPPIEVARTLRKRLDERAARERRENPTGNVSRSSVIRRYLEEGLKRDEARDARRRMLEAREEAEKLGRDAALGVSEACAAPATEAEAAETEASGPSGVDPPPPAA